MKYYNQINILLVIISCLHLCHAEEEEPIAVDSRIKILYYNEYEVFPLVLHYNHQAHIDFAAGETVKSISIGNDSDWYIEPIGSSLFIKPYEKNLYTNMTVITNKRAYEFELISKNPEEAIDKDLIYVVKFFYPSAENNKKIKLDKSINNKFTQIESNKSAAIYKKNTNYSFRGNTASSLAEVFDDGVLTYIKFNNKKITPKFYAIDVKGFEISLDVLKYKNYFTINTVAPRIIVKFSKKTIVLINNNYQK